MNLFGLIKKEQEGPLNYKDTIRRGRKNIKVVCIILIITLGCFLLGSMLTK